jgi:hypothetical protein
MKTIPRRTLIQAAGLACLNPTLPGQTSASPKTEKRFFVGSTVVKNKGSENDFPQVNALLVNETSRDEVVVAIAAQVLEYHPYAAPPQSRVLKPLAVVDIELPLGLGSKEKRLEQPVVVAAGDSATIQLRLFVSYRNLPIPPGRAAGYRLRFVLTTAKGASIETGEVSI